MQCLNNYIGINWCNATPPASGLYVNDLPGLTLKSIDKTASDEQATFIQVWQQVQKRALRMLGSAIVSGFNTRYRINQVYQLFDLGKRTVLTTQQTAAANENRGIEIALNTSASLLQVIYVQQVSLYLKTAQTIAIQVHDTFGALLDTISIDGTQGWNTVSIDKHYTDTDRLLISYSATSTESPLLLINENTAADCLTACADMCDGRATIRGITFTDITDVTYGNNAYGLSVVATIKCDYTNLVCCNKAVFANALWYLLGAEVLTERIHSDRLNRYTTIDAKKALELRDEFYAHYKTELATALSTIHLNPSDNCLDCNQPVTLQTNLP
jgi:hypothetical protein